MLVPSLSLLKQTLREWLAVGEFDYLAVCSDETVAPDDTDAVVASTSELGVPVTTDPAEIAAFLRRRGDRRRVRDLPVVAADRGGASGRGCRRSTS